MRRCWFLGLCLLFHGRGLAQAHQVLHHWSGGLAARSIRVHAMLSSVCDSVRLIVDEDPGFGSPWASELTTADSTHGLVSALQANGLQPGTSYHYRFEVDGLLDVSAANTGHFRTPQEGAHSFSFVTGSCNSTGDHPVWQSMGWLQPLFFLSSGDLHYADPNSLDVEVHRAAYVSQLYSKIPLMSFLHRTPLAYVWDDHDFSGNGSSATSIGKVSALRAYREHVPSYEVPMDSTVDQAFTIGRVRFILSDLRAAKTDHQMMSDEQHSWLRQQFIAARDSGLISCWVSPVTWNSIAYPENWGCQPEERRVLSDWLRENHIDDLFIVSGDAHMLAMDDGTNADFSSTLDSPYRYPLFQAAAINRHGSYKGGVFNQGGVFLNPSIDHGQFGEVLVNDEGEEVCITFRGWRTDSLSPALTLMNTYTFCRDPLQEDAIADIHGEDRWHVWYDGDGAVVLESGADRGRMELLVMDVNGRVIATDTRALNGNRQYVELPALPCGVYIARIGSGGKSLLCRFAVTE